MYTVSIRTRLGIYGQIQIQYIILKYGILKVYSTLLPSSEGYISQYTPKGVYRLIVNEINEGIISIKLLRMLYCLY